MPAVELRDGVLERIARLVAGACAAGTPPEYAFTEAMAEIDRRIAAQLQEILRAPAFRRLEAAWNSLEYLVSLKPADELIRVRVLNVTRAEMLADFEDAIEFDRSVLFKLVYEDEYGQFGGAPFAVIVVDQEFSHGAEDIEILNGLAGVGAAAHTVVLGGASSELCEFDRWSELSGREVPDEVQGGSGFSAWRTLRESTDSRYLGLVLPRVLVRKPYRPRDPYRPIRFREDSFARDGSGLVWGNAAFVLGVRTMLAFHEFGWCTAIRGLREGWGVAPGLPEVWFDTDAPGLARIPPVEVAVTEAKEKALIELGLIPLCRVSGGPTLAFFGVPSLHLAQKVDDATIATNLKLSSRLPYMLAASRFAHYLKVMMRDRVGQSVSKDEIERELRQWLAKYTLEDDGATRDRQAKYPLRAFQVSVRERPGRPGQLEAVTHLQPHYQIEDPGVNLRLAVELPDPGKTQRT